MKYLKIIPLIWFIFFFLTSAHSQKPDHKVIVKNNGYIGLIGISNYFPFFHLKGNDTLTMVADKEGYYYLNTGATMGGPPYDQTSYIYIYFDNNGKIDSINTKTSALINNDETIPSITFNTTTITINPGKYNGVWNPTFSKHYYNKKETITLINALSYGIKFDDTPFFGYNPDSTRIDFHSSFYFTVTENGYIKLYEWAKISAAAKRRELKFKTRKVIIDPLEISDGAILKRKYLNQEISISSRTKFNCMRGITNYVYWNNPESMTKYFHFILL